MKLPLVFPDAGSLLEKLVDLKLIHQGHLIDFALLQDVVGI